MHRSLHEPGVGVGYMVDPAPGRHSSTYSGITDNANFAPYFKVDGRSPAARYDCLAKGAEMATTIPVLRAFDALGLCHFCLLMGEPPFVEWLRAATGWNLDEAEFFRIGRRIQALRHAFNAREGISPAQITLPGREQGEPALEVGALAGVSLDAEAMRRGYYEAMGIDAESGWPLPQTARELGLDELPDWPYS